MRFDRELVALANQKLRQDKLDIKLRGLIETRLEDYYAAIRLTGYLDPPPHIPAHRVGRWINQQRARANHWRGKTEEARRDLERVVILKEAKPLKGGL